MDDLLKIEVKHVFVFLGTVVGLLCTVWWDRKAKAKRTLLLQQTAEEERRKSEHQILTQMLKDVGEIKRSVSGHTFKFDALEEKVESLTERVRRAKDRVDTISEYVVNSFENSETHMRQIQTETKGIQEFLNDFYENHDSDLEEIRGSLGPIQNDVEEMRGNQDKQKDRLVLIKSIVSKLAEWSRGEDGLLQAMMLESLENFHVSSGKGAPQDYLGVMNNRQLELQRQVQNLEEWCKDRKGGFQQWAILQDANLSAIKKGFEEKSKRQLDGQSLIAKEMNNLVETVKDRSWTRDQYKHFADLQSKRQQTLEMRLDAIVKYLQENHAKLTMPIQTLTLPEPKSLDDEKIRKAVDVALEPRFNLLFEHVSREHKSSVGSIKGGEGAMFTAYRQMMEAYFEKMVDQREQTKSLLDEVLKQRSVTQGALNTISQQTNAVHQQSDSISREVGQLLLKMGYAGDARKKLLEEVIEVKEQHQEFRPALQANLEDIDTRLKGLQQRQCILEDPSFGLREALRDLRNKGGAQ